ncbi:citrate lyase subunit alpha [Zymobacter sp. IVIA_5232.4 C2]|uniref:citrate lyase subunit alpha n=1 Tax=Zymobacter sp. IVIA_5232.4 C2 TaxID=3394855 RepID=UPI0039C49E09
MNSTLPQHIAGYGDVTPFQGSAAYLDRPIPPRMASPTRRSTPHGSKLRDSLQAAIEACHPVDGMTVSFHHHLRVGDSVVMQTIELLARMGIKDIRLAASSLTSAHEGLVPYLQDGTVTRIWTSGVRSGLGEAISAGQLATPVVIHSHGGRARAITTGELTIDLAVIAAASADEQGNCTGTVGPSAFGSLGYAQVDAQYARQTIVVSDNIVPYPCVPVSIPQTQIDHVVKADAIGDARKIASGSTRITKSPVDLLLAHRVADVLHASQAMTPGFNFQLGSGGASLAVAKFLRPYLRDEQLKGGFLLGGIVAEAVALKQEGFFDAIVDVQSFDSAVATSMAEDPHHLEISADTYANPFNGGCMTDLVDICVLSALEVDTDFNVNVITGSQGVIMAASGGHSDTAFGARLTVVVCPSFRGRVPTLVERVTTCVTPGEDIDLLVTERGICVNPRRPELAARLKAAHLPVVDIHTLKAKVDKLLGVPAPQRFDDRIVGVVQYRDGSVIDVIRQRRRA